MPTHGAKEQKRLAKKRAKAAESRKQLARRNSDDPMIRLREAEHWPIIAALVPEELWIDGLGQLVLARQAPHGRVAFAVYLVDVFCLGVKDCLWKLTSQADYEATLQKLNSRFPLEKVSPEYFAKLIFGAVDYARSFDLAPHPDFRHARLMLHGIEPSLCDETFEFGQNGKPHYISGPYESTERAQSIARRIAEAGGHFIVRVPHEGGLTIIQDKDRRGATEFPMLRLDPSDAAG